MPALPWSTSFAMIDMRPAFIINSVTAATRVMIRIAARLARR